MPHETTTSLIAGDAAILARRYADALFELAAEQKQIDAVAADLRLLARLRRESAEFQYIIDQPRLTRPQLVKAMKELAAAAGLSQLTSNFLVLTAHNRRLDHLGAIIETFLSDLARQRGEFAAEVRSTRKLSAAQEEQLATKLGSWAGGKVHLSVREEPALLGGIVVKMGSRVIDASVKSRLERLERQLKLENTLEGAA